jgi:hypothetical protein
LVLSLREELASGSPEMRELAGRITGRTDGTDANPQIKILRGEEIIPGLAVDNSITVYLEGQCRTVYAPQADLTGRSQPRFEPRSQTGASGVLGWVSITDGHIDSFIHVDCKRIGQMLGWQGIGRNPEQCDRLMANAIARVILHEWIHIATQNPHHAKHGIAQAQFSAAELMIHSPKPLERRGTQPHCAAPYPDLECAEPPEMNLLPPPLSRSTK